MKKESDLTLGISQSEKVDRFIDNLKHPMLDTIKYLRTFILSIDKTIGEGIFWNGPTFYFTGKVKPFEPKEYKRYMVGINFYKQDTLRLIFLRGANLTDTKGILEGDYKDGRRIISFKSIEQIKDNEIELKKLIKQLIKQIEG